MVFEGSVGGDPEPQTGSVQFGLAADDAPKDTLEGSHWRLGHKGRSSLEQFARDGIIVITDLATSKFRTDQCRACLEARMMRTPFNDVPLKGVCPLDLLHSDIAGPVDESTSGAKYYVTFIDDYTGMVCTFAHKDKSATSVLNVFKVSKPHMERVWNTTIKNLRTDGGGEYKERLAAYLSSVGIVHHSTTRYSPQLNGVAERWNWKLKEMSAAMLIGSGLEHQHWPSALQYAQNVCNMLNVYEPLKKRFTRSYGVGKLM